MSLRRRMALFLDPTLSIPSEPRLEIGLYRDVYGLRGPLDDIAGTLRRLERKTVKRRPRIIECQHPELHPELDA